MGLAILIDLESKSTQNSVFQSHFLMSNINRIFLIFFIEEYENTRRTLIIDIHMLITLISNGMGTNPKNIFKTVFIDILPCLFTTKLC